MTRSIFPNMPGSTRLFIYTSNVCLSDSVASKFHKELNDFMHSWKAHGSDLMASSLLIANRVLLIAVDEEEQKATGCSIDGLNRFLRTGNIDWFNRNWVLYRPLQTNVIDEGWVAIDLNEFWDLCKSRDMDMNAEVINTSVLTLEEARKNLVQKISDSWHCNMI